MEEQELLHACVFRYFRGLKPGAVTPPVTVFVLLGSELRVVDQDVGVFRYFYEAAVKLGDTVLEVAGEDDLAVAVSENCNPDSPAGD